MHAAIYFAVNCHCQSPQQQRQYKPKSNTTLQSLNKCNSKPEIFIIPSIWWRITVGNNQQVSQNGEKYNIKHSIWTPWPDLFTDCVDKNYTIVFLMSQQKVPIVLFCNVRHWKEHFRSFRMHFSPYHPGVEVKSDFNLSESWSRHALCISNDKFWSKLILITHH